MGGSSMSASSVGLCGVRLMVISRRLCAREGSLKVQALPENHHQSLNHSKVEHIQCNWALFAHCLLLPHKSSTPLGLQQLGQVLSGKTLLVVPACATRCLHRQQKRSNRSAAVTAARGRMTRQRWSRGNDLGVEIQLKGETKWGNLVW